MSNQINKDSTGTKETNMQAAYISLKNMIINNRLPTGVPISQTKLIEESGFSRTPLREALNKLAQDGLVHLEQNKRKAPAAAYAGGGYAPFSAPFRQFQRKRAGQPHSAHAQRVTHGDRAPVRVQPLVERAA